MTNAWALVFALLAGAVAAALIWTSTLSGRAIDDVVRGSASTHIVDDLELSLLTYQRLSNLAAVSRPPMLEPARAELEVRARANLSRARAYVDSPYELRTLRATEREVGRYFEERSRLDASGAPISDVLRASQAPLGAALESIRQLRSINEAQVERAHAQTLQVDEIANLVGGAAALLLVLGLLAVVLGVRRYIVSPLVALRDAIRRFRGGETDAVTEPRGAAEMCEVIDAFNEMATALRTQREAQLAYLGGVAHDLRNPLSAMSMAVAVVRTEGSEERRASAVELIDRQVARLTRMVSDLLDATRIEAGALELHVERLDLRALCTDVIELYQPTTRAHDVALCVPDEPIVVDADPLRLEQVLGNLVSNAIKYSPKGGRIDVVLRADPEHAVIEVSDRGIGMTREQISDLFMPFKRSAKAVVSGVGLGLSVVRRIVQAHGGSIDVESELGAGSTFRVTLPRALGDHNHTGEGR